MGDDPPAPAPQPQPEIPEKPPEEPLQPEASRAPLVRMREICGWSTTETNASMDFTCESCQQVSALPRVPFTKVFTSLYFEF